MILIFIGALAYFEAPSGRAQDDWTPAPPLDAGDERVEPTSVAEDDVVLRGVDLADPAVGAGPSSVEGGVREGEVDPVKTGPIVDKIAN